jgi:hypothetical protein
MAKLFGLVKCKWLLFLIKQNISLHINNCYKEKELQKVSTIKESLTVQKECWHKRIAAFLFVWFLERNNLLYNQNKKLIDDNALVALTLMIAESKPDDKDMMVKVIVNLLNNKL